MTKANPKKYIMPASIIKRVLAFLVDLLILDFFVFGPFTSVIQNKLPKEVITDTSKIYEFLLNEPSIMSSLTSIMIIVSILTLVYFSVLQSKFGQTVGMMITKIYAIKIDNQSFLSSSKKSKNHLELKKQTQLKNLSLLDSVLRNIYFIPLFPFPMIMLFEPFVLFFNKNKQRLLEQLSKTMTVEIYDYDNVVKNDPIQRWL